MAIYIEYNIPVLLMLRRRRWVGTVLSRHNVYNNIHVTYPTPCASGGGGGGLPLCHCEHTVSPVNLMSENCLKCVQIKFEVFWGFQHMFVEMLASPIIFAGSTQQTQSISPMSGQCWASVVDGGPMPMVMFGSQIKQMWSQPTWSCGSRSRETTWSECNFKWDN